MRDIPRYGISSLRPKLWHNRFFGAHASCVRATGIFAGALKNARNMRANRRQDACAPFCKLNLLSPSNYYARFVFFGRLSRTHLHKFIATLLQPLRSIKGLASVHSLILLVRTETEG